MKIINKAELAGMNRVVHSLKGGFISLRFILEEDKMGFTMTETFFPKGDWHFQHYKHHLEACYCIEGEALLLNETTGEEFLIKPGVMYVLDKYDPHKFKAISDTKLICVFNPPLKGKEVHQEDGSYSLNPYH